MLNQKEKYTVNIESINNMGNGVTHIDGIVVFVPFAITGDRNRLFYHSGNICKRYGYGPYPQHDLQSTCFGS